MREETKTKLFGIVLGLIVLAGFLLGFLSMVFSEKNREYFIDRLKNIRSKPFIIPEKKK